MPANGMKRPRPYLIKYIRPSTSTALVAFILVVLGCKTGDKDTVHSIYREGSLNMIMEKNLDRNYFKISL